MGSTKKFGNIRLKSLGLTEGIYTNEKAGIYVIDAGIKAPGGWAAGRALAEAAMNEGGTVSFGDIYIKSYKLPTVDICYDSTSSLKWAESRAGSELIRFEEAGFCYLETSELPEEELLVETAGQQYDTIAAASPVSLTAAVFNCAKAVPALLESMEAAGFKKEELFWAWSSCVLPVITDDFELMNLRKKAVLDYGTIVSIWVRTEELKIQNYLDSLNGGGEIRIHNLGSARTFVKGSLNEAKLIEAFNLQEA